MANQVNHIAEERISIRDVIKRTQDLFWFVLANWKRIVIGSLIISGIRITYEIVRDPVFQAETTFILESAESGASKIGSLASAVGVNMTDDGNLFDTDHIVELYVSYRMLKKTFYDYIDTASGKERLITRYAREKKWAEKWADDRELQGFSFEIPEEQMVVKHDSLLMEVLDKFIEKQIVVEKPDRKLSILSVKVLDKDDAFAKRFNEVLVANVNAFYLETETKKTGDNLRILQMQADSLRKVIDIALDKLAATSEMQPNPNPLYYRNQVTSQKLQIDMQASAAVYEEVLKNLELAKVTHRNQMPLIQIIDKPIFPLPDDKDRLLKMIAISGLIAGFLMTFYFIGIYVWRLMIAEPE